jgi:hypothetical protein
MTFQIKGGGVDEQAVARALQERIEEKKRRGLYTDAEVRQIEERRLHHVVEPHDLKSTLLDELRAPGAGWNYTFDQETIYRSSRGGALETIRRLLRPVQKLFWNSTPLIAALSRQKDINASQAHLLHNLVLEMTRLRLELDELKSRHLQLQARLELQGRRQQALEGLAELREGKASDER